MSGERERKEVVNLPVIKNDKMKKIYLRDLN